MKNYILAVTMITCIPMSTFAQENKREATIARCIEFVRDFRQDVAKTIVSNAFKNKYGVDSTCSAFPANPLERPDVERFGAQYPGSAFDIVSCEMDFNPSGSDSEWRITILRDKTELTKVVEQELKAVNNCDYNRKDSCSELGCLVEKPSLKLEEVQSGINANSGFILKRDGFKNALEYSSAAEVQAYIDAGHKPSSDISFSYSSKVAIHYAAGEQTTDSLEKIKILVRAGADVNAQDFDGFTALMASAMYGSLENVTWLVENGAYVNMRDITGNTPLTLAAGGLHDKIVEVLLKHDANPSIKTHDGKTALDEARSYCKRRGNCTDEEKASFNRIKQLLKDAEKS